MVGAGQVEVEDHGLLVELCLDLGPGVQHLGSSAAPQRQGMTPKETVKRLLEWVLLHPISSVTPHGDDTG